MICSDDSCHQCRQIELDACDEHTSHILLVGCSASSIKFKTLAVRDILTYRLAIMDTLGILPTYYANGRMVPLSKNGSTTIKSYQELRPLGILPYASRIT